MRLRCLFNASCGKNPNPKYISTNIAERQNKTSTFPKESTDSLLLTLRLKLFTV
jgi:hypothetical protein